MLDQVRFYLRHSFNDLRVNGRRTLFALLCIAAGVAAIVSLQTLGVMIQNSLTGNLRESNRGDLQIGLAFDNEEGVESRMARDGLLERRDDLGYVLTTNSLPVLEAWFAQNYAGTVELSYRKFFNSFTVGLTVGIPARDTDKAFVQPYIIDGQNYPLFGEVETEDGQTLSEVIKNPTDIVLSRNLADDLGAELGDTVRISGATQDFTLRGIVPTESEGGISDPSSFFATLLGYYYIDFSAAPLFAGVDTDVLSVVYVGLDDPDAVDVVEAAFRKDFDYMSVLTTSDLERRNSVISDSVNELVEVMGFVSLLIGGIGIINTMLVIVSRRTTEIAVLKTLGMEPQQVTALFLTQALLMGFLGGLLGVALGWGMAIALQGIAERFVATRLTFTPALGPALNGLILGVLISVIFGFIPTLAAGRVRPASVLRQGETILVQAGRLRSLSALMVLLLAMSLVADSLIGELLLGLAGESGEGFLRLITGGSGLFLGVLLAVPVILSGINDLRQNRRGRSWALYGLVWLVLLGLLPVLGFAFGYAIPSTLVVLATFILIGSLYLLLLLLIWGVGGGRMKEFPLIGGFPAWIRYPILGFCVLWTLFIVFVVVVLGLRDLGLLAFAGLLFFIHIPTVIITLTLPAWALGQVLQRLGFLDLKIALREMVAAKNRGALTLMALVVGVFVLGTITMLVERIVKAFNDLLENNVGGNVLVFPAGGEEILAEVELVLANFDGVESYSVLRNFDVQFINFKDLSAEVTVDEREVEARIAAYLLENPSAFEEESDLREDFFATFSTVDERRLDSNLPQVSFAKGRQLDPALDSAAPADGIYPIVVTANRVVRAIALEVGDLLTFRLEREDGSLGDTITFRVVGLIDPDSSNVQTVGSASYVPLGAFGGARPSTVFAIAEVQEERIRPLRRQLAEIPSVFVLETRLINQLVTSIIGQFTSLPILVAGLALFTGSIVIANSVALAMLERRREIGVMKAIGLQRERVLLMLLLENGLMGLVGGLIGVGGGVLALIILIAGLFGGTLGDAIPVANAFILMGLCILIALVAALLSVWGASGEKPMNVLRYE
jgi:ABC-type antimicrobial peptide transport system permease subunit